MIGKIFPKSSGSFKNRLRYIFGCSKHDHEISLIKTMDSNCMSRDPLPGILSGSEDALKALIQEFDQIEAFRKLSLDSDKPIKPVYHAILSLRPGETLADEQWQIAIRKYLADLGFGETTKYVAVMHRDKDHEHVHIVANRIRFEESLPMVKDSNERLVSLNSVSEIEDMLGLVKAPQPSKTWGTTITHAELRASIKADEMPLKYRLIAKIAGAIEATRDTDGDMFDFVRLLRRQQVYLHLTLSDKGQPQGVAYELNGKVISGRQLKRSRLTWQKLIKQEGIHYDPETISDLQIEIARRDQEERNRVLRVYYYEFIRKNQKLYIRFTAEQIKVIRMIEEILNLLSVIFGGEFTARRCEPVRFFIDYDISKSLDFQRQTELTL